VLVWLGEEVQEVPRGVTPPVDRIEPIRLELRLPAPPDDAFATFTERLASWWPRDATWSGEALEALRIEPRVGGFVHELGPHGQRLDFGRVTAWDPPHRLAFSWQVAFDRTPVANPSHASEVEVRFPADGGASRVVLEHRSFERHSPDGAAYRAAMASDAGWPHILDRFFAAVERRVAAPWEGLTT
jgi:uncharacterized protein YndB with AHSA1/START domain